MSPKILVLETSTLNCSAALFEGRNLLTFKSERSDQYVHSEKLHVFIDTVLKDAGIKSTELSAVAVSKGPGSYTGLRIGVAAAKGMAYALNIPLISVTTMEAVFDASRSMYPDLDRYACLLDARRMEVYSAVFDNEGNQLEDTEAMVVSEESFNELKEYQVLFSGDGSKKCQDLLKRSNWSFEEVYPSAEFLGDRVLDKFESNNFEDTAYFEPEYLKEFMAGQPKNPLKSLLGK